jgi:hypothetical protein
MSTTKQFDPLTVYSFRAVLVNQTGKVVHASSVSIGIGSLVLQTKETVREAARNLQDKAKAAFEPSVRAASPIASFMVQGLPDRNIALADVYMMTMGRAVTRVALLVLKGEDVGNIPCIGMRMKGSEATVTLVDPEAKQIPTLEAKRGPARGTLSPEVWAS